MRNFNYVVVVSTQGSNLAIKFPSLAKAISLVENQLNESDAAKVITIVVDAMSESGVTIDGSTYSILDATTYLDMFDVDDED